MQAGWAFDFAISNLVAYLTSVDQTSAPRAKRDILVEFLDSMIDGSVRMCLISTDAEWFKSIREIAYKSSSALIHAQTGPKDILEPEAVREILDPFRHLFGNFRLYMMIVTKERLAPEGEASQFFREAAFASQHRALVLMPNGPTGAVNILDPFPALQELAKRPIDPPAVVFWTSLGGAVALSLPDAKVFFRNTLLDHLAAGTATVDEDLRRRATEIETKRILHMSDLHFGDGPSDSNRRYLKSHLNLLLDGIDRVVVTGDLFNSPNEDLRDQYLDFRSDVERMTNKSLIVIPGNHDVRPKGNRIPGLLRQSYEFVVDIGWQALVIDDDLNCVFFCFNSMEESNFARGCITNSQLKRMTASLNEEHARRKRLRYKDLDRYTKIALIHHHPFAYETIATELYDKVVRFTFGDEDTFVRFEEANGFVSWCAELGVSLILHGHKHEPHRVQVSIPIGDRHHSLLAIGCGSTTGAGGSPLSYDVVALNPETGRWSATFYEDPSNAGAGFRIRELTLDTRRTTSSW